MAQAPHVDVQDSQGRRSRMLGGCACLEDEGQCLICHVNAQDVEPWMVGMRFSDARRRFDDALILGTLDPSGDPDGGPLVTLNPAEDKVGPLVALAADFDWRTS